MDNPPYSGKLVVITGSTASGKSLVMSKLLKILPDFSRTITTTTRAKRPDEQDGIDYFFISKPKFNQQISERYFLEYVDYAGNLYGTGKEQIDRLIQGQNLLTIMDPYGAAHLADSLRQHFGDKVAQLILDQTTIIYLDAPQNLRYQRLIGRGESQHSIEARFQRDREVWEQFQDRFPIVIENSGSIDQTMAKVTNSLSLAR